MAQPPASPRRSAAAGLAAPVSIPAAGDSAARDSVEQRRRRQLEKAQRVGRVGKRLGSFTGNKLVGKLGSTVSSGVSLLDRAGFTEKGVVGAGKQLAADASDRWASRNVGRGGPQSAKGNAGLAAAQSLAAGEGVSAAGESAASATLAAQKIRQFRMILAVIRGVAGVSLVGIVVLVLIWGFQLFYGHLLGHERWKMGQLEFILALFVWILFLLLVGLSLIVLLVLSSSIAAQLEMLGQAIF